MRQDLTFLWWRFCALQNGVYRCQQEGVVYADDLDTQSVRVIQNFAASERAAVMKGCPENILVQSRTEFVDGEFWNSLVAGAAVVCFNAPFDLSRLALEYRAARNKNTGWSMVLWRHEGEPDKFKPKLRIKPKDSRSAFISLAGGDPNNRVVYRGRFLDLSVLGWALRNRHMTLNGFLKSFGLKGKMEHEPTGRVTEKELKYGRRDVERTAALLNAMKQEYDGFPLQLPPEQAMSAASITKAFLDEMRVKQPATKFPLPAHILGKCMQSYYGGRSEVRIRHHEVPVVVCDTTSEYPSVAALLKLWPLLIAANVKVMPCKREAEHILRSVDAKTLLDPNMWGKLAFFASVKPSGDVLPVRALYSEDGDTNIGLNPLTCDKPIWYSGPDLAGSKLRTGNTPKIIQAFKLIPEGIQPGMKKTSIGTRTIDPEIDDFFQAVIEERKKLPKNHPHYLLLKIIANALYGIFAELNKYEYGKNEAKCLEVFSGEYKRTETACQIERPGKWQFSPAAALITAGGRLMLAILEQMVEERQGTYLLTDTDSMLFVASQKGGLFPCPGGSHRMPDCAPAIRAITWDEVKEICSALNRLNPYDPKIISDILKIEDCNYDGTGDPHQLFGMAISAKRYVVYKRQKSTLQIIKPSEHGLGIIYIPDERKRYKPVNCKDQESQYPMWIVEAWDRLWADHFQRLNNPESALIAQELWFGKLPAMMRVRVTTPNVMTALRKRDPGAAKPYNFALSPILIDPPQGCTLVAPTEKRSNLWLTRDYVEVNSGDVVKLSSKYRGKELLPQTVLGVLWRHYLHPEHKSLSPDGKPCDEYTSGLLLRRPLEAMTPFVLIGKEIERKAQEGEDISIIENPGPRIYGSGQAKKTRAADPALIQRARDLGVRQLMRQSGAGQHAVERFLRGERVHPSTRGAITKALEKLEQKSHIRNGDS